MPHAACTARPLPVIAKIGESGSGGPERPQIAAAAGLSKPNLLYYFPSKEAIHVELLSGLMDTWLDPLRDLDAAGEPVEEIVRYVLRKLEIEQKQLGPQVSDILRQERVFGFNTYGEQQGGVHMNQTFVGIAFFPPGERGLH